jgi:hypothetical protein
LEGGPPKFRQGCSCPALLEDPSRAFPYGAVTRSGPPFQTVLVTLQEAAGLVRVRSPLLAESRLMSFPPATEMFQFAGFASPAYGFSWRYPGSSPGWVAPFGNPGIADRAHLPRAFRSVLRPSSPLSAKASTRCPSHALSHAQRQRPAGYHKTDISAVATRDAANSSPEDTCVAAGPRSTAALGVCFSKHRSRRCLQPSTGHHAVTQLASLQLPSTTPPPASTREGPAGLGSCCRVFQRIEDGRLCRLFSVLGHPNGGDRARTGDLLLAKQALSQLSYTPGGQTTVDG